MKKKRRRDTHRDSNENKEEEKWEREKKINKIIKTKESKH